MALNVEKAVVPSPPPTPFMLQWLSLSLVSVSVNALRGAGKGLSFLHWLPHLSLSVVCLQETHTLLMSFLCGFCGSIFCFLVHLVPLIRVVLQSCNVWWSFCPC